MTAQRIINDTSAMTAACRKGGDLSAIWNMRVAGGFMRCATNTIPFAF